MSNYFFISHYTCVVMEIERIKLKTPFENPDWAYVYIINSELMIDGGFCSAEHVAKLEEFEVKHRIITHHHIDHVGLVFFSDKDVLIHPLEIRYLEIYSNPEKFINAYSRLFQSFGVDKRYVETLKILTAMNLKPRARIVQYGNIGFKVISTPGHTPGHISVLADKCLFSGDFMLSNTTPNIGFYPDYTNGVADYLQSLRRVLELEIETVYPAHEKIIRNPEKRANELIYHYTSRAKEIYDAVGHQPTKLEDIAAKVTWSIGNYWDFDDFNRFMAICETLAFLHYLEEQGKIRRKVVDGVISFTLC